jgi:serine/threonine protein kinase
MHSRKVYHFDIKSENIMFERQDNKIKIFIADFGIAHVDEFASQEDKIREDGTVTIKNGTSQYLHPQHLSGRGSKKRISGELADSYAAGILLWTFMNKEIPEWGVAVLRKSVHEENYPDANPDVY